jgi:hypothetical protein
MEGAHQAAHVVGARENTQSHAGISALLRINCRYCPRGSQRTRIPVTSTCGDVVIEGTAGGLSPREQNWDYCGRRKEQCAGPDQVAARHRVGGPSRPVVVVNHTPSECAKSSLKSFLPGTRSARLQGRRAARLKLPAIVRRTSSILAHCVEAWRLRHSQACR